jgi:uncharacterized protein (TIGR01615 family)
MSCLTSPPLQIKMVLYSFLFPPFPSPPLLKKMNQTQFTNNILLPPLPSKNSQPNGPLGLCKTKWEKKGKLIAGDYEYIDVNFSGKRYIVEVSLATEFEIARPTNQYSILLNIFPIIFVGKMEELKRIVRLMCYAIKGSMKKMDLHIPPWRRNLYMQTKWFSSYKEQLMQ